MLLPTKLKISLEKYKYIYKLAGNYCIIYLLFSSNNSSSNFNDHPKKKKKLNPPTMQKPESNTKRPLKSQPFLSTCQGRGLSAENSFQNCAGMASFVEDDCLHEPLSIERAKKKTLVFIFIFSFLFFFFF